MPTCDQRKSCAAIRADDRFRQRRIRHLGRGKPPAEQFRDGVLEFPPFQDRTDLYLPEEGIRKIERGLHDSNFPGYPAFCQFAACSPAPRWLRRGPVPLESVAGTGRWCPWTSTSLKNATGLQQQPGGVFRRLDPLGGRSRCRRGWGERSPGTSVAGHAPPARSCHRRH